MPPRGPGGSVKGKSSVVTHQKLRFLITDRPHAGTLDTYLKDLQTNSVSHLVRVCEPSYDTGLLDNAGIAIHDWEYPDGDNPSAEIITNWLGLCFELFYGEDGEGEASIAVHCVAGLGRAPVMVALALIEGGMSPEDAVLFIRKHRKGAINSKQLDFLQLYKPRKAFSMKRKGSGKWWPFGK